jgi:hypothetical protein
MVLAYKQTNNPMEPTLNTDAKLRHLHPTDFRKRC